MTYKDSSSINVNDDIIARKGIENAITDSEINNIDKNIKNLKEEIDERLKLHKRFWFLDNVGKFDIKILPNTDYNYPAKIELFESTEDYHTFVYKYTE